MAGTLGKQLTRSGVLRSWFSRESARIPVAASGRQSASVAWGIEARAQEVEEMLLEADGLQGGRLKRSFLPWAEATVKQAKADIAKAIYTVANEAVVQIQVAGRTYTAQLEAQKRLAGAFRKRPRSRR